MDWPVELEAVPGKQDIKKFKTIGEKGNMHFFFILLARPVNKIWYVQGCPTDREYLDNLKITCNNHFDCLNFENYSIQRQIDIDYR